MAKQRRALPIAAFVAILATLVGVRLWADDGGRSDLTGTDGPAAQGNTPTAPGAEHIEGVRFTEVTDSAGLASPHSSTDLTGESAMTAGAAVADIDDDGDLDLYLTRVGRPNGLFRNDGEGAFTDVTAEARVGGNDAADGSNAAAFADVDGDGDTDLVVTGAADGGTVLYTNDGTGRFTDATAGSGLDDLPPVPEGGLSQMHGLTFADYDRDGRLDLLMTHWDEAIPAALGSDPSADAIDADDAGGSLVCARAEWLRDRDFPRPEGSPPNRGRLYRNEGGGRFRDVSEDVGLPFEEIMGFTGSFADVDDDGWEDLLITGDFCTSRLFRNVGGTRFEDVTEAAAVGTDENGMGSVVADIDGNGSPDWFVTGIGPVGEEPAPLELGGFGYSGNRAYLNDGDGTFTDATDRLGLRNGGWGWGAAIADFGNDGRAEVVMTNGYSIGEDDSSFAVDDPLRFWVPEDGAYLEASAAVGLEDTGQGRALVPFDMDRDGDLDLLVADFGAEPVLLRNDSTPRHWITVVLEDPTAPGNPRGIGAEVVVHPAGGAAPVTQWVPGGGSYESQVPPEVHVGLGDADTVERIEVTWPGATEAQVLEDVAADRLVVVRRGEDPDTGGGR